MPLEYVGSACAPLSAALMAVSHGILKSGGDVLVMRMALGPIGPVGALRESSVLFALAISALFLRERIDRRRVIGAAIIFAGAVLVTV
jgi:uncharacterized membrane protein